MEIQNTLKKMLVISIFILIFIYVILRLNGQSINQEVPKRATFVKKCIWDVDNYG